MHRAACCDTTGQPSSGRESRTTCAACGSSIDAGDLEGQHLTCPSCGYAWPAPFDIASFFWTEVDAWARVLLREIHVLASAYHWCEEDILRLSPWRRRSYLEQIGR